MNHGLRFSLKKLHFKPKSIPQFVLSEVLPSVDCGFFWFLREYLKIQHNHIFRHDWYATFQSILVFKKYSDFLYSIILYNYLKDFEIIFMMIILQATDPFCMDQITLIKWYNFITCMQMHDSIPIQLSLSDRKDSRI